MPTKVAIAGIMGRMGQVLANLCAHDGRFLLVGGTEAPNNAAMGKKIGDALNLINVSGVITDNVEQACQNADVFIDFTAPKASLSALAGIVNTNCKAVIIGTTGFDDAQNQEAISYSDKLAIVKSGNYSLGVNLLAGLVKIAAQKLRDDWDIEIIEAHHKKKVDAPSGTALLLGDAAAAGRGKNLADLRLPMREGITGARPQGGIGFNAIRGGTIIGEHDVRFESEMESLILTHRAQDRSIFAKGALEAAIWAKKQNNGLYNMNDVLGL
jgi:4-hydroxy-tetrahydrodipicolinate reductase